MKTSLLKQRFKLQSLWNTFVSTILYGCAIGVIVGAVIILYSYVAENVMEFSHAIYEWNASHPAFIPLFLLGLTGLATLEGLILKFVPEARGGGVPYTEGVIRGVLKFKWLKMIFATISASLISFMAGLPLGNEGPSIQIGGCIGQGVNQGGKLINRNSTAWRRFSVTGGAAAAFATVFAAPLTGIFFALEEGHKRLTPLILLTASASVLTACALKQIVFESFDLELHVFNFGEITNLPINLFFVIIIIGILSGLFASGASLVLLNVNKFIKEKMQKLPQIARLIIVFVLVGAIGLIFPSVIGSGASLIKGVALNPDKFTIEFLVLLLLVKLLLIALCSGNGACGGIFIPTFVMGALFGTILAKVCILLGIDHIYYKAIILITMSAFMGAILRSPLTAIVLIVETTGQLLSGFLATGIAIMLAYFVIESLHVAPLYETQLHWLVENKNKGKTKQHYTVEKTVEKNSFVVGKEVKGVIWPPECIVKQINNYDEQGNLIIDEDPIMEIGEKFEVSFFSYDYSETINEINALFDSPKNLKKQKTAVNKSIN